MPLTEIWLVAASASANAQAERGGSRTYHATFGPADDENYVLRNCGFGVFDRHPTDFAKMVTALEVKLAERGTPDPSNNDASLWEIALTYGPIDPTKTASPLQMTPIVRIAGTRVTKIADRDKDKKPILNSAGDPFDPPLERDATSLTFYVRRNEEVGSIVNAFLNVVQLSDAINQHDWLIFPARTVKIAALTVPERQYDPVARKYYYAMEYQFEYRAETWQAQVYDAGFRYLDKSGSSPVLRQAMVDSSPATVPVLLDGAGGKLAPPVSTDNIKTIKADLYAELDFAQLGMDQVLQQQLEPIPPPQDGSGGFS